MVDTTALQLRSTFMLPPASKQPSELLTVSIVHVAE